MTFRIDLPDQPRILVVALRRLGDVLLTTPLIRSMRQAWPSATIDVRLVSGYNPERFMAELRAVIDDPRVRIETLFASSTPASPTDTPLYRAIESSVAAICPGAAVVPSVSTGFTDSRVFRRQGIPAYGFMPLLLEPQ